MGARRRRRMGRKGRCGGLGVEEMRESWWAKERRLLEVDGRGELEETDGRRVNGWEEGKRVEREADDEVTASRASPLRLAEEEAYRRRAEPRRPANDGVSPVLPLHFLNERKTDVPSTPNSPS